MRKNIIPEKFKNEYQITLSGLFHFRINLFCYIAIFVFSVEVILGLIFFRDLLGVKDMPGIIGGIFFSVLLLISGKFSQSLYLHKVRAFFFSFLLISVATLAAMAHPAVISYLGITLILVAFFVSALLLPWNWWETIIIGTFSLAAFIRIYPAANTFINSKIFGINIILLALTTLVAAIVKKSEEVLRKRNFAAKKEIEEKNTIMSKELELAKKIHKSILPHSMKNDLVEIAVTYKPIFYMGGDYAQFHFIDKDRVIFVLADVTGHGVSAALLVNRTHTEVERLVRENLLPGELLKRLDKFIEEEFGEMGFFLTAFCGLLNFSEKKLTYSNYGHPAQILLQSRENKIILMQSQTFLMGIGMEESKVYSNKITFAQGDRLILFTDGIIEAKDVKGNIFGQGKLEEFTKNNTNLSVIEFNTHLILEVDKFQSGHQHDDIFLATIQIK